MRAVIWCGLIVASSALSGMTVHYVSKSYYYDFGKSHGSIDARADALKKIYAALPRIRVCTEREHGSGWKEVLSVKAEAIYIKPINDASVLICRA
jgi:hypothetical protein